MTCKDCIHGDLCMDRTELTPFTKTEYRNLDNIEEFCDEFKNKADYVEVVRCKDCKSFVKRENAPDFCSKRRKWTNENDFCSNGERKEDNDKVR